MITREDVDKLAGLARLSLSEAEKDSIQKDLESILGYVSNLAEAPTDNLPVEDFAHKNALREDTDPEESGLHTGELLKAAASSKKNFVAVKPIFGDKK